jgi:hypothetical protein
MQTFLPYPSYKESCEALDLKRLNKQILECYQILRALKYPIVEWHHRLNYQNERKYKAQVIRATRNGGRTKDARRKIRGWTNHVVTRMWAGYEDSLALYAQEACNAKLARTGKAHKYHEAFGDHFTAVPPPWLGKEEFHKSHRANLLRKDYAYYSALGWTENPETPYYWPVPLMD